MNRKNNKGFTLIELLAVIVILAVIALIATPIIMNVINDAKKGAAQDSSYGYIKAVELELSQQVLKDSNKVLDASYLIEDGNLTFYNSVSKKVEVLTIPHKGNKPTGSVVIKDNMLYSADLTFDSYSFSYFDQVLTPKEDGNLFPTMKWQSNAFGSYNGQQTNNMIDGAIKFAYTGKNSTSNTGAYIQTYAESDTPRAMYKFAILAEPNTTYKYQIDIELNNTPRFRIFAFEFGSDFKFIKNHNIDKSTLEFTTGPDVKYLTFRVDINGCTTDSYAILSNFRVFKK